MNDTEKIQALRKELAGPLAKYIKYSAFEELDSEHPDHVDSSYCYDMAREWFEEDWPSYSTILAILVEE